MKTETKYRFLLAAVLTFTIALSISALNAIGTLQNSLNDIDEDNTRQINSFNKKSSKGKVQNLNNNHLNKQPALVPASGGSCPISNLDEFHRSLFFKKD